MALVSQPIVSIAHATRKISTEKSPVLMEEKCHTSCIYNKQCFSIVMDLYENGEIGSEGYLQKVKKIAQLVNSMEESRKIFRTFCMLSFLDRYCNSPMIVQIFIDVNDCLNNWTIIDQLKQECLQLLTRMTTIENLNSHDTEMMCLLCCLCNHGNVSLSPLLFEVARSVWPYINRPLWTSDHFVDFICDILQVVGKQLKELHPKNFHTAWMVIYRTFIASNVSDYSRLRLLTIIEHGQRNWNIPNEITELYKEEYKTFIESKKKGVFSAMGYIASKHKTSLSVKPGRSAADFLKRRLSSEAEEREQLSLSSNSGSSECLSEVSEEVFESDECSPHQVKSPEHVRCSLSELQEYVAQKSSLNMVRRLSNEESHKEKVEDIAQNDSSELGGNSSKFNDNNNDNPSGKKQTSTTIARNSGTSRGSIFGLPPSLNNQSESRENDRSNSSSPNAECGLKSLQDKAFSSETTSPNSRASSEMSSLSTGTDSPCVVTSGSSETASSGSDGDRRWPFLERKKIIVKVPNQYVGRVIGTKGATIMSIQDSAGATVKLVRPATRRADDHQTDSVPEEKVSLLSKDVGSGEREEREEMEGCKTEQSKVEEESEFEIIGTDETISKAKEQIETILRHAKNSVNRTRFSRSVSEVAPHRGGFPKINRSLSCPIADWGERCSGDCEKCKKACYCRHFMLSRSNAPTAWIRPEDLSLTRNEDWVMSIVETKVSDRRKSFGDPAVPAPINQQKTCEDSS